MDRRSLLLITFFVEGGLFLVGLLLMGGANLELRSRLSVSLSSTAYALLLCLPMLAMLYFAIWAQWPPLSGLTREIEEKLAPIFTNCKILDLAIIAFLAGTSEELFFRGWLQGFLTTNIGVVWGILVASTIFGLAHYLSPTYAIYAGVTGLYLGVIYQATGNLYIMMTIHAVYDFIALLYLVPKKRGKVHSPGNNGVH